MKPISISKVLLINLPEEGQCADFYTPRYAIDDFSVYPPLGLLYVATVSKDYYPVEIMDVVAMNYGIKETVNEVLRRSPTVLGISCTTFRIYPMAEIIRQVKSKLPDTIIIVGGPHCALYPVETVNLHGIDYVIVGDGEYSFKKLLDAISSGGENELKNISGLVFRDQYNKIVQIPPDKTMLVDNLPFPDWRMLNYNYYYTSADQKEEQTVTMISSRGCPFRCNFCDVKEKNYRWRPAKAVVDEMERIAASFPNPVIHVFDDTFNIVRSRVLQICDEIKRRNLKITWTTRARVHPFDEDMIVAMKEVGLKRIHFGVESGSETTLRKIKKGITKKQIENAFMLCNKYDIDVLAYFIIGFDWETKKDIKDTISFIKYIQPTFIMANTLYPAAKTEIYEELLKTGKLQRDFWREFVSNPTPNFILPKWQNRTTRNYLRRKLDEIYLKFYLSPSFMFRNVTSDAKNGFSIRRLFFKARLAFLLLKSYLINLLIEKINISGEKNEI